MTIAIFLAVVAAILAGLNLVRTDGKSELGWAVLCLAALHLLGLLD